MFSLPKLNILEKLDLGEKGKHDDNYVATSHAASWTFDVTLIVSVAILFGKGFVPFMVWVVANCIAMALYGRFVDKYPDFWDHINKWWVISVMVILQFFYFWINMGGIKTILDRLAVPENIALYIVYAAGIAVFGYIGIFGLRGSLVTDQFQWKLLFWGAWGLAIYQMIATGLTPNPDIALGLENMNWAFWAAAGLFAGPFIDAQQWQRKRLTDGHKATDWASLKFAGYMTAVVLLAVFSTETVVFNTAILLLVLLASTSTMDSIASVYNALGKKIGFVLGIIAVVGYGLLWRSTGLPNLWSTYAIGRIAPVLLMIFLTLNSYNNWIPLEKYKPSFMKQ